MSEVNLFDLPLNDDDDDDPAGYHVLYQRVGPLIGAEQLGLSVYELPPGQSVCAYHYEVGSRRTRASRSIRTRTNSASGRRTNSSA